MKKIIFCSILIITIVACISSLCLADEIRGRVEAIDAGSKIITVSGVKVRSVNAVIENEMGGRADFSALAVGNYLEIEGSFTGAGEMIAVEIEKELGGKEVIKGRVEKIDPENNVILVGGITVTAAPNARIEDDDDGPISIEQIPVGAYVDCEGSWSGALAFKAHKIELD